MNKLAELRARANAKQVVPNKVVTNKVTTDKVVPTTKPAPAPAPSKTAKTDNLLARFSKRKTEIAATKQAMAERPPEPAKDLLAAIRARNAIPTELPNVPVPELEAVQAAVPTGDRVEKHEITYELLSEEQRLAVDYAVAGESFCLIGSAGTGKSTTQRIVLQQLQESGSVHRLQNFDHKYLPSNAYSIAVCSFSNKAVENIRALLPDEFKPNACTIHKLIEFAPETEEREYIDEDTNEVYTKNVQVFKPRRHEGNPIRGLTHIVIEEASTISLELFDQLLDALEYRGENICFIFLGDLKQLPPVFGMPILSKKLRELEYVELTRVYRQALESPIKKLAIAVNEGKVITDEVLREEYEDKSELRLVNLSGLHPKTGKQIPRRDGEQQVTSLINHFVTMLRDGEFVPFRDIILCPHRVNKRDDINCDYLNEQIADAIGQDRNAEVHEIIAGRTKRYFAIGDPVLYAKEEYKIIDIATNANYQGVPPKLASTSMDRAGYYRDNNVAALDLDVSDANTEAILNMRVDGTDLDTDNEENIVRAASHIITLEYQTLDPDAERTIEVSTVSEIANMDFAYALTVHKSIGSEWDSVFFTAHHSHMRMLTRELFYTACTRAKNHLTIYFDGQNYAKKELYSSTINKAITSPAIKGVTVQEKLDWLDKQELIANEDTTDLLSKFKS